MRYKIKYSYLLLIVSVLFSSCGTSKNEKESENKTTTLPNWINNYKDEYPDLLYLSSMGVSEYKSMAEKQAYQGIASSFEVQIKSSNNSKEVTYETADKFTQTYSEVFDIATSTDQDLINIKTSESYFDKTSGKYYILATLNKSNTSAIYQRERNKLLQDAESIYNKSKNEDDILLKIAYISNSIAKLEKIKEIEQKLSILNNSNIENHKFKKAHELVIEREKMLEHSKVIVENSDTKIYNMLKRDFTDLGFKLTNNASDALIKVDYSLSINDSNIKNADAKFVMWNLDVNLINNNKKQLFGVYSAKGRSSQLTSSAAKERAYFDIDKKIKKEFTPFLISKILRIK
jgi:hypothetical protein